MLALNRSTVLKECHAEPGVVTVYGSDRFPLFVEWALDVRRRLVDLASLQPVSPAAPRMAAFYEVLATTDESQVAKVFDRLVNLTGRFPALMRDAPPGARHRTPPADGGNGEHSAGKVTEYTVTGDSKMMDKLRQLFEKRSQEPAALEWLAYTLYSNGLLDESITCYQELIANGSREEEHFFYCGNAQFKKGDLWRAVELWAVAKALSPGSTISRKSEARLEEARRALLRVA